MTDQARRLEFERDGHLLIRGLATRAEIDHFRPAIRNAAYALSTETRDLEERDTYGKAFLQVMNLWRHDALVREFVLAKKFATVAAALLGVERVRIFHDQALIKEPKFVDFCPENAVDRNTLEVLHVPLTVPSVAGNLDAANGSYVLSMLDRALAGCQSGEFTAMATAPVHKGVFNAGGVHFTGHTEYLAEKTATPLVVMMLAGNTS